MMRTLKVGLVWALAMMMLMGTMNGYAQEEENAGSNVNIVEHESAKKTQESSDDEKQPKAQAGEETPDEGQIEREKREDEKPVCNMPEETKAHETLAEQDVNEETPSEDERPIAVVLETEVSEAEKSEAEQVIDALFEEALPEAGEAEAEEPEETPTEAEEPAQAQIAEEQTPIEQQEAEEVQGAQPVLARSVEVERVMPDIIHDGELFQLKANLVGFDDADYELQWQYDDGHGWTDAQDERMTGAKALTLDVVADAYDVNYNWRVLVTIA